MEQTKWFYLLLAVCLMFAAVFTGPVSAQEEEDPCIAAGTCEDTAVEEEEPAEDFFTDEEGIFITADGTTESLKLENSIDAAEAGAAASRKLRLAGRDRRFGCAAEEDTRPFAQEKIDDFQPCVPAPAGDEDNLSGKTIHHASFSSTARYNGSVFVPTTTMSARMTSRLRPWRASMPSDGPE